MKLYGSSTPSPHHKQKSAPAAPGKRLVWQPIDLPEGVKWRWMSVHMARYLEGRKLPAQELQDKFGLTDWPDKKRLIIPYFNAEGDLIYFAAHSYFGVQPKYLYPKGPKPLYVPWSPSSYTRAMIVEGQFDAQVAVLAGWKGIGIGGCHLAPHVEQDLLEEIEGRDVTVCLDGDALEQASKLVQRLLELGVYAKIAILRPGEDPASVGIERLKKLIG